MLVKNSIYYILTYLAILSISILIYSIKTKKNFKSIIIIDIIYLVYIFLDVGYIPEIFNIDIGWDFIVLYPIAFVSGILYIISIIISKKRSKKIKSVPPTSKVIILMLILIILPIITFSGFFIREYILIKNSELIIEANYQNGIIISNDYQYAISEDYCEEVSINIPKRSNFKLIETYYYDIIFNDSNNYDIRGYIDEELKYLDKEMLNYLLLDAKENHNNLNKYFSDPYFNKDKVTINKAYITYFKDTDYYLVEIGYDKSGQGGMSVVNAMIYKGKKFIDEIFMHGNIEKVKLYEK